MVKLTREQYRSLLWLSKQDRPMWGGIYDNGRDPDVALMLGLGLIEAVPHRHTVGKAEFSGGYRITDAGRLALFDSKENDRG
jgi:hypothetical protein